MAYEMRISDVSSDVCSSDVPVGDGDELRRHSGRSTVPTHSLKAAHCSSRCWQGIVTGRGTLLPAAALSGSCSLRQSREFVSPRKPCYPCTYRRTIQPIGFTSENVNGNQPKRRANLAE